MKLEKSLQYFLRINVKSHIDKSVYDVIHPNGTQPGAIYGLAKIHKANTPLRPVISMVNTPQYELGKYLDKVIKKVIPDKYMLKSTDDFLTKLHSCNLNASRCRLVSFDVESLFTNVPLKEVIKLASRYVYESDDKPSYDRSHFEKLLEYATSSLFSTPIKFFSLIFQQPYLDNCLSDSYKNYIIKKYYKNLTLKNNIVEKFVKK